MFEDGPLDRLSVNKASGLGENVQELMIFYILLSTKK